MDKYIGFFLLSGGVYLLHQKVLADFGWPGLLVSFLIVGMGAIPISITEEGFKTYYCHFWRRCLCIPPTGCKRWFGRALEIEGFGC